MTVERINTKNEAHNEQIRLIALYFLVLIALLCTPITSPAQGGEDLPKGVVPPPLSIISKDEKKSLEAEKKLSDRVKLALDLMDSRLMKATDYSEKDQYQNSLDQLGNFQAILRNTSNYLKKFESDKRAFKNFKRFEMGLRKYLPRLELIRRATPYKYGYHVRNLIKTVRATRQNAIKPLFGNTVLPKDKS